MRLCRDVGCASRQRPLGRTCLMQEESSAAGCVPPASSAADVTGVCVPASCTPDGRAHIDPRLGSSPPRLPAWVRQRCRLARLRRGASRLGGGFSLAPTACCSIWSTAYIPPLHHWPRIVCRIVLRWRLSKDLLLVLRALKVFTWLVGRTSTQRCAQLAPTLVQRCFQVTFTVT